MKVKTLVPGLTKNVPLQNLENGRSVFFYDAPDAFYWQLDPIPFEEGAYMEALGVSCNPQDIRQALTQFAALKEACQALCNQENNECSLVEEHFHNAQLDILFDILQGEVLVPEEMLELVRDI